MLKVHRRIAKLEQAIGLSGKPQPFLHRINFIDGDGRLAGTMVMSDDPALCQAYREENEGEDGF